ncbi:MAG: hypothetical protein UY10_C0052G0002 [Microgenomates group bacterium GW2011_GWA2_47_8]|nr:MAG: hypothetical protein UY10_C0052G0002 [Microgenomates group bacterium GW2011_GWA2_47_8]
MIKRSILPELEKHLQSDQMTILIGPRQVGKTYLMNVMRQKLIGSGKTTIWFNLDNQEDKEKFSSQTALLSYINLVAGSKKACVFIDEIQRKDNAGLFLKGIFDMGTRHKFIISGSGSLELKANIPESMAGRKRLFTICPVSFEEFVNHKTRYAYEKKLTDYFTIEKNSAARLLSEYMVFGGYPRVILASSAQEKAQEMQEIYRSYIDRDIRDLLNLEKTDAFTNLLKVIASQIGSLTNVTELASTIGLDQKTISKYLSYLEQTFIITKVTPFYRNIRKEITKAPIYYFTDTGLRNWLLGLFGLIDIPPLLRGHIFENVVFNTLKARTHITSGQIHFWRTKDNAEVDFVLGAPLSPTPVEVKYQAIETPALTRSYHNFLSQYHPTHGYIIHLGKRLTAKKSQSTINFLPFWQLFTKPAVLY